MSFDTLCTVIFSVKSNKFLTLYFPLGIDKFKILSKNFAKE